MINISNITDAIIKIKNTLVDETLKEIANHLTTYTTDDVILISEIQDKLNLSYDDIRYVLDILSELGILSKYTYVHLCPICGKFNSIMNSSDIEHLNDFTCSQCDTIYSFTDTCLMPDYYCLNEDVI